MNPTVLVGLGGIAGAICRHLVGERVDGRTRDTLAVNLLGSFALGFLLAVPVDDTALLVLGTGFCGAFTTFSSFAFETVRLAETDQVGRAAVNASANLVGALVAIGIGTAVAGLL